MNNTIEQWIESQLREYKSKFDGIGEDGVFKKSVEEFMWLRAKLAEAVEKGREDFLRELNITRFWNMKDIKAIQEAERERLRREVDERIAKLMTTLPSDLRNGRLDAYHNVLGLLASDTTRESGEEHEVTDEDEWRSELRKEAEELNAENTNQETNS